jgi:hypothetical protein
MNTTVTLNLTIEQLDLLQYVLWAYYDTNVEVLEKPEADEIADLIEYIHIQSGQIITL